MLSLEMRALMANRDKWEEDMRNLPIGEKVLLLDEFDDLTKNLLLAYHANKSSSPRLFMLHLLDTACQKCGELGLRGYYHKSSFF